MATYAIRDIEQITGIKAHTLRIWEKRYNILKPERTETNIRHYDDEDLKKVLNIAILRRNGMKISKIVSLDQQEIRDAVLKVSQTDSDDQMPLDNLLISMLELDEARFEKVLANCILRLGFKKTILEVIYPFFNQIGVLWQIGTINPAQEHFISNLIRQKLIVATDHEGVQTNPDAKSFLLFLPEGELHELGILFYNYLIRKAGHKSIYLGQTVPLDSAAKVKLQFAVDYVVTSVHNTQSKEDFERIIQNILDAFPGKTVILTNRMDFATQINDRKRLRYNLSVEEWNELLKV